MTISYAALYRLRAGMAPDIPPIPPHLSHWNPHVKEYAVKYSGHGCPAVWGRLGVPPKEQWMYLQDARRNAYHWCGVADTISGDAEIIHMPTQQNIGRWY